MVPSIQLIGVSFFGGMPCSNAFRSGNAVAAVENERETTVDFVLFVRMFHSSGGWVDSLPLIYS